MHGTQFDLGDFVYVEGDDRTWTVVGRFRPNVGRWETYRIRLLNKDDEKVVESKKLRRCGASGTENFS